VQEARRALALVSTDGEAPDVGKPDEPETAAAQPGRRDEPASSRKPRAATSTRRQVDATAESLDGLSANATNLTRVAESLSNRAVTYADFGHYAQAEALFKQSLALFERALGPDDPALVETLAKYAALLRTLGKLEEASELDEWYNQIQRRHP
jgi:tetratricopeptide (TPR) repeat protein